MSKNTDHWYIAKYTRSHNNIHITIKAQLNPKHSFSLCPLWKISPHLLPSQEIRWTLLNGGKDHNKKIVKGSIPYQPYPTVKKIL